MAKKKVVQLTEVIKKAQKKPDELMHPNKYDKLYKQFKKKAIEEGKLSQLKELDDPHRYRELYESIHL